MLDRTGGPQQTDAFPAELMIWLSPVFPVGGFAYSQGLETAVERGWVSNAGDLAAWLSALAAHGSLRNDLIILSLVRRAGDQHAISELSELSAALQPSRERAEEALTQGEAFLDAYRAAWEASSGRPLTEPDGHPVTLPVAVGLASRAHGFDPAATLTAYATAFATNLVSAAIRLGVAGQFDGQRVLARALPDLHNACQVALDASEDELGSATFAADLAAILHETQQTRLFRS